MFPVIGDGQTNITFLKDSDEIHSVSVGSNHTITALFSLKREPRSGETLILMRVKAQHSDKERDKERPAVL